MNRLLGTTETLNRLGELRAALQDFHARAARADADFRARTAGEIRAHEAAMREFTERQTGLEAVAEANHAAALQQLEQRFERRKARINRAHIESRRRAMEAIRRDEDKRKYKVQEGTLSAEKQRDEELAAADAALKDFQERLARSQQALADLGVAVRFAFSGYGQLTRMFSREMPIQPEASGDPDQMLHRAEELEAGIRKRLAEFKGALLPKVFRFFPLALSVIVLVAGGVVVSPVAAKLPPNVPWREIGIGCLVTGALLLIGRMTGAAQARPAAEAFTLDLARAHALHHAAFEQAHARHQQNQAQAKARFEETRDSLNLEWRQGVKQGLSQLGDRPAKIDQQAQRVSERNKTWRQRRLAQLDQKHPTALETLAQSRAIQKEKLETAHRDRLAQYMAEFQKRMDELATEWRHLTEPLFASLEQGAAEAQGLFPDWTDPQFGIWTPPAQFINAARFGNLEVSIDQLGETAGSSPFPVPAAQLSLPMLLKFPEQGSILIETSGHAAKAALAMINGIIFRLLASTPPGKLSFTIFDPVGLGQNFAGLMHLADYEESHINSRIWTQSTHLEEKLAELNEHMEKVIQMYLRNEYPTIAEYNAKAGTIAEKYHFLVIADFPVNFTDTALRRLVNIVTSGARCGVYTLIHWDQRQALPQGFVTDDLRKYCLNIIGTDRGFSFAGTKLPGTELQLDAPPAPEVATRFLKQVGESSRDSNRVEVPFSHVAPPPEKIWTEETGSELRVPIGRSGATKFQYLEIGKGTRQHALIAGKTGSGKSTLFHIIITNLALWCSPEEVEFYLVDFKKGVEFKGYATAKLPHARVVAIESDRQFGLSVLERVDAELRRRGDLFRELGVQDLAGYRRAGGREPLPRSLLLIDEFQEFFTEEDRVSQGAAVLLDRIVRQGRAFGIHVILGSQTLGGAYTLARATLGQMVIRIALQCNEADAYLIMDQDNPAPRLLSRPGEGIYNDAAGSIEGNSPFQAVWLSEDEREKYLELVRARANQSGKNYPGPFVFEGNAPADVRDNFELQRALETKAQVAPVTSFFWLGAPNSIKGPTQAVFRRQSGNNLLIVGQSDERLATMLGVGLISIAAQFPPGKVRFVILDGSMPGQGDFVARASSRLPGEVTTVKPAELSAAMNFLADRLKSGDVDEKETFVFIQGLHNLKKLRPEDEFSFSASSEEGPQPSAILQNLITEGPARGIHVIASIDTYNNVNRFLGRKMLSEFEMRVLFQMSASDSAALIDDPDASTLGLHRALYYNDREGYLETFRPYSQPDGEWVEKAIGRLRR